MNIFKLIILVLVFQISSFAQGLTICNNAVFNLGSATLSLSNDLINNGTFNPENGDIFFTGSTGDQTYIDTTGVELNNITVNKSSGDFVLSQDMTVNGTLTCASGDLNLNGKIIYLGPTATLSESSGSTVKGITGHIEATRVLNAPNNVNVAGLGFVLTTTHDMGSTRIVRKHNSQATNRYGGILRNYEVTTTNNSGLDATLSIYYDADELNGLTEADLQFYKSSDNGSSWFRNGGTINVPGKFITLNNIADFSDWTLSNNEVVSISNPGNKITCPENSSAPVFTSVFLTDPDDQNLNGAVFQITNNFVITEDKLTFTNQNGITGSWDQSTAKLTLSGTASKDSYSKAVRSVSYKNSSANAVQVARTVSLYVNDGVSNSNTITKQVEVISSSGKPYLILNTGGLLVEGETLLINNQMLSATDPDGSVSEITYNIITEPVFGQLSINSTLIKGIDSFSFTQDDIANGKLVYSHNGGESESDFFTFKLTDDKGEISNIYTFSLSIEQQNDPPKSEALSNIVFKEDETISFGIHNWYSCIYDPDNPDSVLTFQMSCDNENICVTAINDTLYEITGTPDFFGTDTMCVVIRDPSLDSCVVKTAVIIEPVNDMPLISGFPPELEITCFQLFTLEIMNMLSDIETENNLLGISLEVEGDSIFASYNSETGMLSIISIGTFTGETNLLITVSDEQGGMCCLNVPLNISTDITGNESEYGIPEQYILYSNYPNPFNPSTIIRYGLPRSSGQNSEMFVQLKIYDLLGNEIVCLVDDNQLPGFYEYSWNASDISSGVYFYRLSVNSQTEQFSQIKKMLLIK